MNVSAPPGPGNLACYFDFDFPNNCGSEITSIVRAASGYDIACRSTADLAMHGLRDCAIVLGLETFAHAAFGLTSGATYNVSLGLGSLHPTSRPPGGVGGWNFLAPFTWPVWVVFAGTALAAFASQLVLGWLVSEDVTRVEPVVRQNMANVAMTAFTSILGASRFYGYYDGAYLYHATSMLMAIFSVFINALYQSNLIAFLIPDRFPTNVAQLDGHDAFAVHWLYEDIVRSDLGSKLAVSGSSIAAVTELSQAEGTQIIAPEPLLQRYCSPERYMITAGTRAKTLYSLGFAPGVEDTLSEKIIPVVAQTPIAWTRDSCYAPDQADTIRVVNVWGVFALAAGGFAISLARRLWRAYRTEESIFGREFRFCELSTCVRDPAPAPADPASPVPGPGPEVVIETIGSRSSSDVETERESASTGSDPRFDRPVRFDKPRRRSPAKFKT